jgi:hypothetical protein
MSETPPDHSVIGPTAAELPAVAPAFNPGHTPQVARARTLSCPSCGGSVTVRANGISITAICASCGSTLDVANPDVRLIAEAQQRTREPPIAIGVRGLLVGTLWEVAGFQSRTDTDNGWSWDEYLLFNPYRGFRFLIQDDENWTLYCMLRQDVPDPEAGFEGRRYEHQSTGTARTTYVLGEFYWRTRVGDEASVTEYADRRSVLSREQNREEIIWSRGVRLNATEVQAAFGMQAPIVSPEATEKSEARLARRRAVKWIFAAAALALIVLQSITFGTYRSVIVLSQTFHTTAANEGQTLTSAEFDIPGKGGNVWITARSQVYNNWVELTLALVGPGNVTYSATRSIEYYAGEDSDGAWSEGAQYADVTFKSVPGGSYRLLIEPYAGGYRANPSNPAARPTTNDVAFSVTVTRHVPDMWSFWLAFLLVAAYPSYCLVTTLWQRVPPPRTAPPRAPE